MIIIHNCNYYIRKKPTAESVPAYAAIVEALGEESAVEEGLEDA